MRSDWVVIGLSVVFMVVAGVTHYLGGGAVLAFGSAAAAVALLAALVGRSVEQLGDRFGPGAAGVLQSALAIAGNAIENVVGVQLAAKNRSEYAFAVVINSPLQIALVLAPLLVILSSVLGSPR